MGGGRQMLRTSLNATEADPIDTWACRRRDGRDLISAWAVDKAARGASYAVVQNNADLAVVDYAATDYLLGIFANGHLPMEYKRDRSSEGQPSLAEMTLAAIKMLQKNQEGYLLVVRRSFGFFLMMDIVFC